jgi:membrane protein YqaA with SNARE-associated domain/molybdopterin converting factor small subunit
MVFSIQQQFTSKTFVSTWRPMATIWIPSLLRSFTGGLSEVPANGATVREAIDDLEARYPGIKARLIAEDRLKPNLALVVDGVNSRKGLRHPLTETSEVHFVPAISGGVELPTPKQADMPLPRVEPAPDADTDANAVDSDLTPPTPKSRLRALLMLGFALVISGGVLYLSTYFRDALIAFGQLGLVGLFLLSIIGNATVFIPAPAFVVACAAGPIYGALATGLVAGVGSAIGELTGYMAGYGGTAVLPQGRLYQHLHRLMQRFGPLVIFIMAALPNPAFDVGGLIAGALKMKPLYFLLATAAGKALRLTLVAFVCTGGMPWLSHLVQPTTAP